MLCGNYLQAAAIKIEKTLGRYAISVDYLPDNLGHKFFDEYHNVGTVDKEAVLDLAQKLKNNGTFSVLLFTRFGGTEK